MKKIFFLLSVFFCALAVYAQDKRNNFSVAFETSSYSYEEPSVDVKLHGRKNGVSAEYLARNPEKGGMFFAAQALYMTGGVTYEGHLMDSANTPYSAGGIRDYYFEGRLLLGLTAKAETISTDFWPYLGVGYRRLFDGMGADPHGYDRTSRYIYIPAGIRARVKISSGWALALTGEYDIFMSGSQTSDIGIVITNEQNNGYGMRASVRLSKDFGRHSFFIEPFYRMWDIGDSQWVYGYTYNGVDYYVHEPPNTTKETGVKIGLSF